MGKATCFVGVVVLRGGLRGPEVLLVQRAPGENGENCWAVPGGSIEFEDITLEGAASRELEEETGLRALLLDGPVHVDTCTFGQNRYVGVYYAARVWDGVRTLREPEKHTALEWCLVATMPQTMPCDCSAIMNALRSYPPKSRTCVEDDCG
jgi:ADP-ribose pyrophosphatase YjhB (NUDIX family)